MLALMGKVVAFAHLSVTTMGVWVVVLVLARISVAWLMMGTPAARPECPATVQWTVAGAMGVGLLTAVALMPWQALLGGCPKLRGISLAYPFS